MWVSTWMISHDPVLGRFGQTQKSKFPLWPVLYGKKCGDGMNIKGNKKHKINSLIRIKMTRQLFSNTDIV